MNTNTPKNPEILVHSIEQEMQKDYLRYSMSVIISRALPDARDGLKPSQRRVLYAMLELRLNPQAKHRKCAKITGDTNGDWHPHGESVIYPTLVRMAQPWVMRYPLINGQGNFGSIDGDPAAAMRYTEAKLTSSAMLLMEDLDKETVDFAPNYDDTKQEPLIFPSRFPNLLANGSSGIAVGMATNIPPHNLNELIDAFVLLLDDPNVDIESIMEVLPGPDFPTGGIICGTQGIYDAFFTGRGKLILRGSTKIEQEDDKTKIVIEEIPYNINKSDLISQIAHLVNEKIIQGITDICDESDKHGMRVVLSLKKGEPPEVVQNQLFKSSSLQVTFGCNMVALDNGLPHVMNIKQFMNIWIQHRSEVIQKRTQFNLNKSEARRLILEGYLQALDHLDNIVSTIRRSKDRKEAKEALLHIYTFTEKQIDAILDLRLYQLTGLERGKIEEEHRLHLRNIQEYQEILSSQQKVKDLIKEELLCQKNDVQRMTKILSTYEDNLSREDLIVNESVVITISTDDYIKRMPINIFREQKRGGQGVVGVEMRKESDSLKSVYIANTHDYLLIFTNLGRCYWLKVWQIPEAGRRSKGKALINFLEDIRSTESITAFMKVSDFHSPAYLFFATKYGIVKKSDLQNFSTPRRKGIYAITIDDGDEVISVQLTSGHKEIMLFTRMGMAVRFGEDQVRPTGRTSRGVRGIAMKEKDCVVSCEALTEKETLLILCENGYGKRSKVGEFRKTSRGGKGVKSIIVNKRNGYVVAALSIKENEGILLMSKSGQTLRTSMEAIRVMGRSTQGVRLVQIQKDDTIVGVQKITAEEV